MRIFALTLLALAACSLRPYEYDASATGTGTSTGGTTAEPTSSTTSSLTGLSTTSTSSSTTSTATSTTDPPVLPDVGGAAECGPWMQECPEGQKCAPYSGDGDNAWESWKCVDIAPNPADVGQPCTAFDIASGGDTCDKGLMCWFLDLNGEGTCVAMCGGTIEAPTCPDPSISCTIGGGDAYLILCLPNCDPLIQDCNSGELCIPNMNGFICVLDASGDAGQAFDACEYANACDPGLVCLGPEYAAECDPMAPGCCIPLCDTSAPTCPGQGQECLPWYTMGMAPPGLNNVGVCTLPGP